MSLKKIAVVVNPSSAGGRTLALWPAIENKLKADGFQIISHISASEADFRMQVRAYARQAVTVGICGGDSSLTIAAEELGSLQFRGELFFLPAGSVNDIVLDIRGQSAASKRRLYLGELQTASVKKIFIGQANWGLGVVVNRWVGKILRRLPFLRPLQNLIGFFCILASHLARRECIEAEIDADGKTLRGKYSIVLVSQIRHWASGLLFCPQADYLEPQFQVVLVKRCNLIQLIRIILAAKTGRHLRFPQVQSLMAKRVGIRFPAPQSVQVDGDILANQDKEIRQREFSVGKQQSAMRLLASIL